MYSNSSKFRLFFVVQFFFIALACLSVSARTWTNQQGVQIEAELVKIEGKAVLIKRLSDFRNFKIPIETLSDADQKYLESLRKQLAEFDKAIVELRKSYPEMLERAVYKARSGSAMSFRRFYSGQSAHKVLKIDRFHLYDGFKSYFEHVSLLNFESQIVNIREKAQYQKERNEQAMGNSNQRGLQAELNLRWIDNHLLPHISDWEKVLAKFKKTDVAKK